MKTMSKNEKCPPSKGESERSEQGDVPLSYRQFKEVLHQKHPETRRFNRARLRQIYRDYKKTRQHLKR